MNDRFSVRQAITMPLAETASPLRRRLQDKAARVAFLRRQQVIVFRCMGLR